MMNLETQTSFCFSGLVTLEPQAPPAPLPVARPRTATPKQPPVDRTPVRLSVHAICAGQGRFRGNLRWINARPMANPRAEERTVIETTWGDGFLKLVLNGWESVDGRDWFLTEVPEPHPIHRFSLRRAREAQRKINAQRSVERLFATIGDIHELVNQLASQQASTTG